MGILGLPTELWVVVMVEAVVLTAWSTVGFLVLVGVVAGAPTAAGTSGGDMLFRELH